MYEAAEVGKGAAGVPKDVKNKGLQTSGSTALSYAAVAASGTVAATVQNKQKIQITSGQTQREITVNISKPLTI